ncbi:uncharacterized protein [Ptychodera flava]|uniref:uncharacterized protein n=1 Tax=Ptychodera flava TaxID=63121 RepID=UPI00396A3F58
MFVRLKVLTMTLSLSLCCHCTFGGDVGRGHMKPFGFQSDPTETTEELDYVPHPTEFYEKYVKLRKPVMFRGAATKSQAYHLWTEEYIRKEYGNLTARIEGRHENATRVPLGEGGILGRDAFDHFIRNYQTMDAYMISQVPKPMEKDVAIPPCLLCGTFAKSIHFLEAGPKSPLITVGFGQTTVVKGFRP